MQAPVSATALLQETASFNPQLASFTAELRTRADEILQNHKENIELINSTTVLSKLKKQEAQSAAQLSTYQEQQSEAKRLLEKCQKGSE